MTGLFLGFPSRLELESHNHPISHHPTTVVHHHLHGGEAGYQQSYMAGLQQPQLSPSSSSAPAVIDSTPIGSMAMDLTNELWLQANQHHHHTDFDQARHQFDFLLTRVSAAPMFWGQNRQHENSWVALAVNFGQMKTATAAQPYYAAHFPSKSSMLQLL